MLILQEMALLQIENKSVAKLNHFKGERKVKSIIIKIYSKYFSKKNQLEYL
jgi:hypothetical protein